MGEAVSVVHLRHFLHNSGMVCLILFCHLQKFGSKGRFYFRAGHPAKGIVGRVKTDVIQLVKVAEDSHLSKLSYPGDKNKL